nr:PREDICTED: uncharacterized protein LOC109043687 [Bemisia tabaci]
MSFSRKHVSLLVLAATVAVLALVMPQAAGEDQVHQGLDKLGEDTKNFVEGVRKQLKDAYDGLSPETKSNIASVQKTLEDTAKSIKEKTTSALESAKVDENVKAFQAKIGELYENAKKGLETPKSK